MLVIGFGYKVGLLIEGIELSKGLREPESIAGKPAPTPEPHGSDGSGVERAPAIVTRISG
jgi:hypothetical protein